VCRLFARAGCMYACRRCDSGSRRSLRITRVESDVIFVIGMTLITSSSSPTQLPMVSETSSLDGPR
jgi:organic radical activating enzyme